MEFNRICSGGASSGPSPTLGAPPTRRHSSGGDELASQTATLTMDGGIAAANSSTHRQRTSSGSGTLQYTGQ